MVEAGQPAAALTRRRQCGHSAASTSATIRTPALTGDTVDPTAPVSDTSNTQGVARPVAEAASGPAGRARAHPSTSSPCNSGGSTLTTPDGGDCHAGYGTIA